MSIEHGSWVTYDADPHGREFMVRPLGEQDDTSAQALRLEDFTRRLVAPGYVTEEGMHSYINAMDKGGMFGPHSPSVLGLFLRDEPGTAHADLVAFRRWGASTYPAHDLTDVLLSTFQEPGKNNDTPAYTDLSCTAAAGEGYGTVLRHATALLMHRAGFVVAGRKVWCFDWPDHVDEIARLGPVTIKRSESAVQPPIKEGVLNAHALQRDEVYVGISLLIESLEDRFPYLRNYQIVEGA